jgi:protein-tyrosine-phosphatase
MVGEVSRKGDGLKRVLFLCHDNYQSGRFCEELFNSLARAEGQNWQGTSRAVEPTLGAAYDEPMAPQAVDALRRMGIAPVNHGRLPLGVTAFDLETNDLVIAVDADGWRDRFEQDWPDLVVGIRYWSSGSEASPKTLARQVHGLIDELLDRPGRALRTAGAGVQLSSHRLPRRIRNQRSWYTPRLT